MGLSHPGVALTERKIRATALYLVKVGCFAIAYYALARLGITLNSENNIALIWPPAGFALAILLIAGPSFSPGIFIGCFFANYASGNEIVPSLSFSVLNTMEPLIGTILLRRYVRGGSLESVKDALRFTVISLALSSGGGLIAGLLFDKTPWHELRPFFSIAINWMVGDFLSLLVVAPLILNFWTFFQKGLKNLNWKSTRDAITIGGLVVAVSTIVFLIGFHNRLNTILILPVIIAATLRFEWIGASLVAVTVCIFCIWGLRIQGHISSDDLISLQIFLGAICVSGFILAGSLVERRKLEQERSTLLRKNERDFRNIACQIPQLVWTNSPEGVIEFVNPKTYEFLKIGDVSEVEKIWSKSIHPDDRESTLAAWASALQTGTAFEAQYRMRDAKGDYLWFLGRATPIRDDRGQIEKWFGTATNIDVQVRSTILLEQERETRRRFVGMVAHDLRAPLTNARLILQHLIDPPDSVWIRNLAWF